MKRLRQKGNKNFKFKGKKKNASKKNNNCWKKNNKLKNRKRSMR